MRLKMTTAEDPTNYRYSGVLAHPTSFPSPYGIGDFGKGAYDFIDFLAESGQHLWQILPMVPITSFGNSPYQGYSVFAGEPLLISPELLLKAGLLDQGDLQNIPNFDPGRVDYDRVREYKYPLYKKAFECFEKSEDSDLQKNYDEFCQKNEDWLADYCLYMALKEEQDNLPWTKWPEALRNLDKQNRAFWEEKLKMGIHYQAFLQFMFDTQWYALKKYANDKGIAIVGDIPIFVSPDGADVWANRKLFQVDTKGYPSAVAGVPPDYFSATGQKWGNPLYDWKEHKKEGYRWWIDRVKHQLDQVDYVRIDHFRGFEAYWEVPFSSPDSSYGSWTQGPGLKFFKTLEEKLGTLPIIAEDLGFLTPGVIDMRDNSGFPGMKILQFAFEGTNSYYLPHNYIANTVAYVGTHDNETARGWFEGTATPRQREQAALYTHQQAGEPITEGAYRRWAGRSPADGWRR